MDGRPFCVIIKLCNPTFPTSSEPWLKPSFRHGLWRRSYLRLAMPRTLRRRRSKSSPICGQNQVVDSSFAQSLSEKGFALLLSERSE